MGDQLAAPLQYDPVWGVLLAVLTLAPVVLLGARSLLRAQRSSRPRAHGAAVRAAAHSRIDAVLSEHAAGEITERTAHSRLSVIVRDFVSTTGDRADRKTLRELESSGAAPSLVAAVRLFYDGAFGWRPTTALDASAAAARAVVTQWTN
jgi:hypothetical protein